MKFTIFAESSSSDNANKKFVYDNITNVLTDEDGGVYAYKPENITNCSAHQSTNAGFKTLKKSQNITLLKIQLGLSCNYSCEYCSQKFVERPKETSKKDIKNFMEKLSNLNFSEQSGLKIEFWGGEPLVYLKTLQPLVEEFNQKFSMWNKKPQYSIITNGSLLSPEVCAWLYANGFSVSISHDGPGQSVRGPDPFDDPVKKKSILDFFFVMSAENRISFNPMLNSKNQSRVAIRDWFYSLLGTNNVAFGEGGLVDAYDEDGYSNSLNSKEEHFTFRKNSFIELMENEGQLPFPNVTTKINGFINAVLNCSSNEHLGQKCGMDVETNLAIDLNGNVITCQNVSAVETAMNGESHLGGNIVNMKDVEIKTSTHWKNRKECSSCPVLTICKGACMFLEGKYWDISCANSYSDAISIFAVAFEKITGYIPYFIDSDVLPDHRKDIFGEILEHKEIKKYKTIPLAVVNELTTVNGIEVYTKSKIGS